MDDIYYIRLPEPEARGISIVPDLVEFFEMGFSSFDKNAQWGQGFRPYYEYRDLNMEEASEDLYIMEIAMPGKFKTRELKA